MQRHQHQLPISTPARGTRRSTLAFPNGLFGFESARDLTLVQSDSEHPFGWLECKGEQGPSFLVVEPQDVGQAYQPEISREDAAALGLGGRDDTLVLAVVTHHDNGRLTLNLKSPIIINLKRGTGRQIIPRNVSAFTSQFPLEIHPE